MRTSGHPRLWTGFLGVALPVLVIAGGPPTLGPSAAPRTAVATKPSTVTRAWTSLTVPSGVLSVNNIACPTTTECVADNDNTAANGPTLIETTDAGASWTVDSEPSTFTNPRGISCASATVCEIGGTDFNSGPNQVAPGAIGTTDGGANWVDQPSPPGWPPNVQFGTTLDGMACPTTSDCVGSGGTSNIGTEQAVATTTDGGASWTTRSVSTNNGTVFNSVSCPTTTTCYAAGNNVGLAPTPGSGIIKTTDGGSTWTEQTLPATIPGSNTTQDYMLGSIACPTVSICFAGGSYFVNNYYESPLLMTVDGGAIWTGTPLFLANIYDVSCATTTDCVLVGAATHGAQLQNQTPAVYQTTDDGQTWQQTNAPFAIGILDSVTCLTPSECYAAGLTESNSSQVGVVVRSFTPTQSVPTVTSVSPTSGTTSGGTQVTIIGTNFTSGATVSFGTNAATGVSCASTTSCVATSPAGSGVVDVTVTTAAGTSATSSGDKFTYTSSSSPTVTSISPAFGPPAGGTQVTITGTNFTSGATVAFGTNAATGVSCASTTSCVATSPHGTGTVDVTVTTPSGTSVTSSGDKFTYTSSSSGPTGYFAVSPARICDTRTGQPQNQCSGAPLGAGATKVVTVAGNGGVPASGASAVVLNVTAANPTQTSYLTVFPDGETKPLASSLNFHAGANVPNLVTVALPQDGKVDVYNAAGSADLIVDVEGYYAAEPTAGTGLYNALTPVRICDTRTGEPQNQCTGHAPGPSQAMQVTVVGQGGVPSSGVAAVVLNVTAIGSAASGYLTVYPYGISQPSASNVNYRAGEVVPNRVMVPLGKGGMIAIYSGNGDPNVAVDVSGWFTDSSNTSATGALFTAAPTPVRICDTRTGQPQNQCTGKTLTAQGILDVQTTGHGGVPTAATAVVANVTVANETSNGYLTIFPGPGRPPNASDLNFTAGDAVANMAVATLGSNGQFDAYNSLGRTDVIVDLVGWYS